MAGSAEKVSSNVDADRFQCEYVPFGAKDKIKLSFDLILKWLAVKTVKGAVPSEQDLMKFLMTCKARKLNPFDGDAFLVGYDGKDGPVFSTIVAHQALLKRAETHPEFDGMESGVIVQDKEGIKELTGDFFPDGARLLGGWSTVFFVNRRHPMTKRLKLSTFNKGWNLWKSNPEGMIVKCAEADALRSSFPQLIGGMYLREEMGTDADRASAERHFALEDRRAEHIPAQFDAAARQRAFLDRSGQPVNGGKANHYQQDATATKASERIRGNAAAFREDQQHADEEVRYTTTAVDPAGEDLYAKILAACNATDSYDHAMRLSGDVTACLEDSVINTDQAAILQEILTQKKNAFGETS